MKFAIKLKKKMIPEWQDAYINYELLKTLLTPFKKTSKLCSKMLNHKIKVFNHQASFDEIDSEDIENLKEFEIKFQKLLFSEVDKINTFFHMKLLEFKKEWEIVKFNCMLHVPKRHTIHQEQTEGKQIKNAIFIFYKKLDFLMEYMNLNMEGVRKVLKKHRKICKTFSKNIEILDVKPQQLFFDSYISQNSELLLRLKDEVKKIYLYLFYNKFNKHIGHKELQEITKTRIISVWDSHFYFFFSGCTLILLIVIVIMGWYGDVDPDDNELFSYIFPIFRGAAFIIIYIWLLGWNAYGWTRYHVNYKRMFKFNYHFSSVREILKRGTIFSSVFLITFIWYIMINEQMAKISDVFGFMDKTFIPLIIWIMILGYILFPAPVFNWEGRKYFFRLMFKIFFLSFFTLDFTMAWATDQMVSFVTPIKDLEYTFCYYISRMKDDDDLHPSQCRQNTFLIGFMAAFIPVFYRMVQCTRSMLNKRKFIDPDLLNFFKYFFTLMTSIFSYLVGKYGNEKYVYIWIGFAAISAIYSYTWDLKMDWGLLQPNKRYKYLREKLIYPRTEIYYFAIVVNLFLRFAWILTISPGIVSKIMRPELFTLIIGSLEMLRRSIWNFLRVEKEFILNSENYQALENYTLPHKYDPMVSIDDNIKHSLGLNASKGKIATTMDNGETEEEFKRNFGLTKGTDLRWPLLRQTLEESNKSFRISNMSENNHPSEKDLKKKKMTNEEEILLKMEASYQKNYPKKSRHFVEKEKKHSENHFINPKDIEARDKYEEIEEKKEAAETPHEKTQEISINNENRNISLLKKENDKEEPESAAMKRKKRILEKEGNLFIFLYKKNIFF